MSKKLKEIDPNIFPDCPGEFLHQSGTMGIICDREGLKYIVTPPLVKVCEYLYDLNIRTLSAGAECQNELGVWIEYQSLSDENKDIVDSWVRVGILYPCDTTIKGRLTAGDVRLSLELDFEKETIQSASEKALNFAESLGLKKQDVFFGVYDLDTAIYERIEKTSCSRMQWNGKEFESRIIPTQTKEEAFDNLISDGWILDGDKIWISRELYNKHVEYISASQKKENEQTHK